MKRTMGFVMGVFALVMAPVAASAQSTEYPIQSGAQVLDFGAKRPGQSFEKNDCGFRAGATADLRLDERGAGTASVGSDGCVRVTVRVLAERRVSIDGREYPAVCGTNRLFVTAPEAGPGNNVRRVENRFEVVCAASSAVATGGTLPATGGDASGAVGIGAALTAIGAALVIAVRRRRTSPELLA